MTTVADIVERELKEIEKAEQEQLAQVKQQFQEYRDNVAKNFAKLHPDVHNLEIDAWNSVLALFGRGPMETNDGKENKEASGVQSGPEQDS